MVVQTIAIPPKPDGQHAVSSSEQQSELARLHPALQGAHSPDAAWQTHEPQELPVLQVHYRLARPRTTCTGKRSPLV